MADRVERVMEEMVPELDDLARKRIFKDDEIRQIVMRRRSFEYLLIRPEKKPQDYLTYVRYEVALECLRRRRSKALHWKSKSLSDYAGVRRLHFIFSRGIIRFKGDLPFWYQYIDFCLRSGSTRILSKVLLKALRYHPKEEHLWLLGADRELRNGNIKSARTLLLRGIRALPRAAKVWSEFVKLEVQVAQQIQKARKMPGAGAVVAAAGAAAVGPDAAASADGSAFPAPGAVAAPAEDVSPEAAWGPARVLLRRGLGRLGSRPRLLAQFCTAVAHCAEAVCEDTATRDGSDEFVRDVRQAIVERRPGAGAQFQEDEADVAVTFWELWWQQELAQGRKWSTVVKAVVSGAPPVVVQHCATALFEAAKAESTGAPGKALLQLADAACVVANGASALAVLGALERHSEEQTPGAGQARTKAVYIKLLNASALESPDIHLKLLSWRQLSSGERVVAKDSPSVILRSAQGLSSGDAARLLTLALLDEPEASEAVFSAAIFALGPDASPALVVSVFLARAQAQGIRDYHEACDVVGNLAGRFFEKPAVRMELLASALSAELQSGTPSADSAKRVCSRFEALLTSIGDSDPQKIDWWVRYAEFVQRAAVFGCGNCVPSGTDLHRRAMRSVSDQALMSERLHRFLQVAV